MPPYNRGSRITALASAPTTSLFMMCTFLQPRMVAGFIKKKIASLILFYRH